MSSPDGQAWAFLCVSVRIALIDRRERLSYGPLPLVAVFFGKYRVVIRNYFFVRIALIDRRERLSYLAAPAGLCLFLQVCVWGEGKN